MPCIEVVAENDHIAAFVSQMPCGLSSSMRCSLWSCGTLMPSCFVALHCIARISISSADLEAC